MKEYLNILLKFQLLFYLTKSLLFGFVKCPIIIWYIHFYCYAESYKNEIIAANKLNLHQHYYIASNIYRNARSSVVKLILYIQLYLTINVAKKAWVKITAHIYCDLSISTSWATSYICILVVGLFYTLRYSHSYIEIERIDKCYRSVFHLCCIIEQWSSFNVQI